MTLEGGFFRGLLWIMLGKKIVAGGLVLRCGRVEVVVLGVVQWVLLGVSVEGLLGIPERSKAKTELMAGESVGQDRLSPREAEACGKE